MQRRVWVICESVLQRRHQRLVELNHVQMAAERREVLAEDAKTTADLQHNIIGAKLGEAVDHAEDVGVDQEVLAKVVLRTNVEFANPAQAWLNRQLAL